ncbi:MAG: hypothetical protein ABWX83_14185, partial [Luteibacter sp.]
MTNSSRNILLMLFVALAPGAALAQAQPTAARPAAAPAPAPAPRPAVRPAAPTPSPNQQWQHQVDRSQLQS